MCISPSSHVECIYLFKRYLSFPNGFSWSSLGARAKWIFLWNDTRRREKRAARFRTRATWELIGQSYHLLCLSPWPRSRGGRSCCRNHRRSSESQTPFSPRPCNNGRRDACKCILRKQGNTRTTTNNTAAHKARSIQLQDYSLGIVCVER